MFLTSDYKLPDVSSNGFLVQTVDVFSSFVFAGWKFLGEFSCNSQLGPQGAVWGPTNQRRCRGFGSNQMFLLSSDGTSCLVTSWSGRTENRSSKSGTSWEPKEAAAEAARCRTQNPRTVGSADVKLYKMYRNLERWMKRNNWSSFCSCSRFFHFL